ncbi:MAG: PorT family protein [Saprospiraceae bacterium]|nr:PorT family protein [Saprospiraceae bacterium]
MRYIFSIFILTLLFIDLSAQSFGIRAGLNYSKLSGPTDSNGSVTEKFGLTNGFHFGINYAYQMDDDFAVKAELLYNQMGTNYSYNGASYYKIPFGTSFVYEKGLTDMTLKVSNAYITIPVMIQYQLSKKIELNAGIYGSVLIAPRGSGTIFFESTEHPTEVFFKQSLVHNYYSDNARGTASIAPGPAIIINGNVVQLAKDAGAYYNFNESEKNGNTYNSIDFGLTGGVSYFINKGFYIGFRYDYGLTDVTNNAMNPSRRDFDETNDAMIFKNQLHRHIGLQASFGFRF